jgi:hypothetical protein
MHTGRITQCWGEGRKLWQIGEEEGTTLATQGLEMMFIAVVFLGINLKFPVPVSDLVAMKN